VTNCMLYRPILKIQCHNLSSKYLQTWIYDAWLACIIHVLRRDRPLKMLLSCIAPAKSFTEQSNGEVDSNTIRIRREAIFLLSAFSS
jgi:hypothetical protein